jgi:urea carboxylase
VEWLAVMSVTVMDGGMHTTVQDIPGRLGYWHVGVPPSGPMDDLSHRLVNRVLGNHASAAALELTGRGPVLRFEAPAVFAVGGTAMPVSVNGIDVPQWTPIDIRAGAVICIGQTQGPGWRATLAVRGGFDVPVVLGSRSTFTLGQFGGYDGRALREGDVLDIGDAYDSALAPVPLAAGVAPCIRPEWNIGVLAGPHGEPDFIAPTGVRALLGALWTVHFNSARTGVRLVGPPPKWARADGGDAGLHPSNIHDTGYAFGTLDLTGDMPIILGPDGPSLGGFVCPLTVATAEQWKLGQLAPGDRVKFVLWDVARAAAAVEARDRWLPRCTDRIEPVARPPWNHPVSAAAGLVADASGVVRRRTSCADRPDVTFRQAGDRFVLVEYGAMEFALDLRMRVQALSRWVAVHLRRGVVDATPGVRSLLIHVDGESLSVAGAIEALDAAQDELADIADEPFESRIVSLPMSWDDPATRQAIERYMRGVRPDAPWCPWNIEFIRRMNGLADVDDVRRIVFDASYLVLGLGDVYLGAPVAVPLDPRHRLVTTKYNPARTWTPENAVGIGGTYLCIYGMEGPGGYQFVGRTVQVWNRECAGPHFTQPWLLRTFDQLRWVPVSSADLLEMRAAHARGALEIDIEPASFRLSEHQAFVTAHATEIEHFRATQQAAFAAERERWAAAGEFAQAGG